MERRPTGLKHYPQLIKEWHPEKNGKLTPNDVSPRSWKIVWWICESGHEWQAPVRNRIIWPRCPVCNDKKRSPAVNLRTEYPDIADQWHPEKNGELTPKDVTPGSSQKVWWKGTCGHEWLTRVDTRTRGSGCPICFRKRVTPESNLRVLYPDIADEWHPEKNGDLTPEDVARKSFKRVWWKCKYGHEWQARVSDRTRGNGCPVCGGRRAAPDVNLRVQYPDIADEWHPEKNGDLTPEDVTSGSGKRVWWKCKYGHEWQTTVHTRKKGRGCPICAPNRVTRERSLGVLYPEIAREWHPTKNGNLTPEDLTPGSQKKVWWKGTCGHEWMAVVERRKNGAGCPVCAEVPATPAYSLRSLYPEIAKEWHPEKNGNLTPEDVTRGSGKKVWWKGTCGHAWQAAVRDRARGGASCPVCARERATLEHNLQFRHPEIAGQWHPEKNGDLTPKDVTPRSHKRVWWKCRLGHEWETKVVSRVYNRSGCPHCARKRFRPDHNLSNYPELVLEWHPVKNGIFTPADFSPGSSEKVWWKGKCGHEWKAVVKHRKYGAGCPVCARKGTTPEFNLQVKYPEIAKQWHPEKNGDLTPEDVTPGSSKRVWWTCKSGHEWRTTVSERSRGYGCPVCARRWATPEFNLRTQYPDIAKQWHQEKNGDLKPDDVLPGTSRIVWWKCEYGHEWRTSVGHRKKGTGCPVCTGRIATPDVNLKVLFPEIAKQWHPEKNGDLKPDDVVPGSNKRVWWKCECGHEWQAMVIRRKKGSGCPVCALKRGTPERNLRVLYPEIAKEWHPEKNGDLTPEDVTPGSSKRVWWKCKSGHEWRTAVSERSRGYGCPVCARRQATPEFNLRTQYPDIAKQWHQEENGKLTPDDVVAKSRKTVWWKCELGHQWQSAVNARTGGTGCPVCAGKGPAPEFDLRAQYPELAKEWHPEKNGNITPEDVTPGNNNKVWWKCKRGHEWQATVFARKNGTGCPVCARKRATPERNLRVLYPELAKEWHPEKNGDLTPEDVTPGSSKRVWWIGECGHEWQTRVSSRASDGSGCPQCARKGIRPNRKLPRNPPLVRE